MSLEFCLTVSMVIVGNFGFFFNGFFFYLVEIELESSDFDVFHGL